MLLRVTRANHFTADEIVPLALAAVMGSVLVCTWIIFAMIYLPELLYRLTSGRGRHT
ncbi:hypothetical protein JNW90_14940 [Micromonospora sp. STR1s_5]|nr:hypothetical protein [Micromonospora sp. STR1s_5]